MVKLLKNTAIVQTNDSLFIYNNIIKNWERWFAISVMNYCLYECLRFWWMMPKSVYTFTFIHLGSNAEKNCVCCAMLSIIIHNIHTNNRDDARIIFFPFFFWSNLYRDQIIAIVCCCFLLFMCIVFYNEICTSLEVYIFV